MVVDRGRTRLLPEIQAAFDRRLDERQGIVRAEVSSAHELAEQEKAELRGALERLTGRRVEAAYRLDPALLAGTVVRVGFDDLRRLRAHAAGTAARAAGL